VHQQSWNVSSVITWTNESAAADFSRCSCCQNVLQASLTLKVHYIPTYHLFLREGEIFYTLTLGQGKEKQNNKNHGWYIEKEREKNICVTSSFCVHSGSTTNRSGHLLDKKCVCVNCCCRCCCVHDFSEVKWTKKKYFHRAVDPFFFRLVLATFHTLSSAGMNERTK
jgi:hypothetical protein